MEVLLREDGRAVAVGDGAGSCCRVPPLPAGLSYLAVACAAEATVFLRSDGRLLAAGAALDGPSDRPVLLNSSGRGSVMSAWETF